MTAAATAATTATAFSNSRNTTKTNTLIDIFLWSISLSPYPLSPSSPLSFPLLALFHSLPIPLCVSSSSHPYFQRPFRSPHNFLLSSLSPPSPTPLLTHPPNHSFPISLRDPSLPPSMPPFLTLVLYFSFALFLLRYHRTDAEWKHACWTCLLPLAISSY